MPFERSEDDHPDLKILSDLSLHWERIFNSFGMHNEQGPNPRPMSQTGNENADLLAQLTTSSNMFPPALHPSYLAAAQQTQSHQPEFDMGQPNQPPLSPVNLASSSYSIRSPYPLFHDGPSSSSTQEPTYSAASPTNSTRGRSRAPGVAHTQASPSTTAPVPEAGDDTDYDDKRRRNTAASARFRIKKKQRAHDLERTVSDLTGRAEDLEREASDLRRENGWLKEIIMLKGGHLAGINLSGNTHSERGPRRGERREKRRESSGDNESESDKSVGERLPEPSGSGSSKGKGKGKGKI